MLFPNRVLVIASHHDSYTHHLLFNIRPGLRLVQSGIAYLSRLRARLGTMRDLHTTTAAV